MNIRFIKNKIFLIKLDYFGKKLVYSFNIIKMRLDSFDNNKLEIIFIIIKWYN